MTGTEQTAGYAVLVLVTFSVKVLTAYPEIDPIDVNDCKKFSKNISSRAPLFNFVSIRFILVTTWITPYYN